MTVTRPIISWEAIVKGTTPHITQYNYICTLNAVNINDPGYGQILVDYYIVDNIGHIFQIKEINYGGNPLTVRVEDLLQEDHSYGPYNDQIAYVYSSLYQAALIAQAKLNRLDESAEDFVRSLGVDPTVVNAILFNVDYIHDDSEVEGTMHWNNNDNTIDIHTGYGSTLPVGQKLNIKVYNNSGDTILKGKAVYPNGAFNDYPTIGLAQADTHENVTVDYGMTTTSMDDGEYGFVTWFGKVYNINTSIFNVGDVIYISDTNPGEVTNVRPTFPSYAMQIGIVFASAIDGQIFVTSRDSARDTFDNFHNGTFRESIDFSVTSTGGIITGSLSPANGHPDLTMVFSDGFTILTTTPPATIILIPGTDTVPVENFIYITQSTKVLAVSTADWPTIEHIKVASIVLRSAISTELEGALKNQNWNDHVQDTNTNQGHLSHIAEAIRKKIPASWDSGAEGQAIIVPTSTPDDVYITVTGGIIYQLHKQAFPAINTQITGNINIVNNFTTPYFITDNLNTQILDAIGNNLANKSFSFVLWGIANKTGENSHIMINLPTGSYAKNSPDLAVSDAFNYSVYNIPKIFQGTGFLIARFTFVLDAVGATWTLYKTEDLRGKIPNATVGGGAGGGAGVTSYSALLDTPSSMVGFGESLIQVNTAGTSHEYVNDIKINSINEYTLGVGVSIETALIIDGRGYDIDNSPPIVDKQWANKKYIDDIDKMVYPSSGIALSTGSAWGPSIVDNSTNWNNAYSHITSTGADHSYINQSVTTTATPTFGDILINGTVTSRIAGGDIGRFVGGPDGNDYLEIDGGSGDYARLVINANTILNANASGIQITGSGTFSSNITTIAPTVDLHAATKKYVDDKFKTTINLTGDLLPSIDSTYDIGSTSKRWKDIMLSSSIRYYLGNVASTSNYYSIRSDITFSGLSFTYNGVGKLRLYGSGSTDSLSPATTSSINLGSSVLKWKNIYASGTGSFGGVLTSGNPKSLATSGYATTTEGLQIRWGTFESTLDGNQSFSFSTPFSNACFVVVTDISVGNTTAKGTNSFLFNRLDEVSGTILGNYIALGY